MKLRTSIAVAVLIGLSTPSAHAQSGVVTWGGPADGVPALPPGLTYVQVAAGTSHSLACRSDGSIAAWGFNGDGQCNVPPLPSGLTYVEVAGGTGHTVARRSDGSVVAWGLNSFGQCNVPPLPSGLTYVEIASGYFHSVARRSDGWVVAWGKNDFGQCDTPPLPSGLSYVEIAAGDHLFGFHGHTVARRSDGSVVKWGDDTYVPPLPSGLTYTAIAAGESLCMALRSDGTIAMFGDCFYWPTCQVPLLPNGLTYVAIAAGWAHMVAVRSDGAVVAWGDNSFAQLNVPPLPSGLRYVEVAAGENLTIARFEGCPTCEPPFCLGDGGSGSAPCPCGNQGASGRGCDNSASTGGARLTVHGSVEPDRVALGATDVISSALCIFFQARSVLASPVAFGDGARCIGGTLERIGLKTATTGSARYPGIGDPSISARSAGLGDPIQPGTDRYYQVHYRDVDPAFCNPAPATFNASNAVMVRW